MNAARLLDRLKGSRCPASTTLAKNDNYLGRCDGDRFGYFLGLTLAFPAALPSAALRR